LPGVLCKRRHCSEKYSGCYQGGQLIDLHASFPFEFPEARRSIPWIRRREAQYLLDARQPNAVMRICIRRIGVRAFPGLKRETRGTQAVLYSLFPDPCPLLTVHCPLFPAFRHSPPSALAKE
jgi:hypothetical protein